MFSKATEQKIRVEPKWQTLDYINYIVFCATDFNPYNDFDIYAFNLAYLNNFWRHCSNDAENSALHHRNKYNFKILKQKFVKILLCFWSNKCSLNKQEASFKNVKLADPNLLKSSVVWNIRPNKANGHSKLFVYKCEGNMKAQRQLTSYLATDNIRLMTSYLKVKVTYSQLRWPILGILHLPLLVHTHSSEHTPGAVGGHSCCGARGHLGVWCLAQGHLVMVLKVERALYIHSPHLQSLPDRDSNSQPFDYESDSLPLGHDFPKDPRCKFCFKSYRCNLIKYSSECELYKW